MTKRFGFTLAEVLITLGIIGVVAAMTMPTLINQTNGAQYKAAYKKALSAISQGVTLNVALEDQSFADVGALAALKNRMNIVNTIPGTTNLNSNYNTALTTASDKLTIGTDNTTLFFNDGSVFSFLTGDTTKCTENTNVTPREHCKGFIDVNGEKGPNRIVTCDGNGNSWNSKVDTCTVTSPTDIYPVEYYDQTIVPATDAAKAVLYGK